MRILHLALKDLSQVLRDRKSLLFLVAMPILFTIFMSFAYKSPANAADARLRLAWVDPQPQGLLDGALFSRLQANETLQVLVMAEDEAQNALQKKQLDGILLIPANLEADLQPGESETAQIRLIADSTSTQGQSLYQILRAPIAQMMSAVEIARLSTETGPDAAAGSETQAAFSAAWRGWLDKTGAGQVQIEQATARPNDPFGGNPYNQSSPGILVMFAIFGLITSAQILVQERKLGTLRRLISTAMKPEEIIAGHMLAMFALVFGQSLLLFIFGQFALKVDYLRSPLAVLLVAVAMGLWVASLGLLIGVLAKSDEQVNLIAMVSMFIFSALGGVWFPLEGAGKAFSYLGKLMPSAWAMNGFQNILIRGLDLASAWIPAGILLLYALAFFSIAALRFRRIEA
jgi:ABC-2 type transport system permease protein